MAAERNDQGVNASAGPDPLSRSLLDEFYRAYDIHSINVSADADIRDDETSLVDIQFAAGEETESYQVNFKLLGAASRTHRYLKRLGPRPHLQAELTAAGTEMGQDSMRKMLCEFVEAIRDRVIESALNIQSLAQSGGYGLVGNNTFAECGIGGSEHGGEKAHFVEPEIWKNYPSRTNTQHYRQWQAYQ